MQKMLLEFEVRFPWVLVVPSVLGVLVVLREPLVHINFLVFELPHLGCIDTLCSCLLVDVVYYFDMLQEWEELELEL